VSGKAKKHLIFYFGTEGVFFYRLRFAPGWNSQLVQIDSRQDIILSKKKLGS
jgi:hypothetical protein